MGNRQGSYRPQAKERAGSAAGRKKKSEKKPPLGTIRAGNCTIGRVCAFFPNNSPHLWLHYKADDLSGFAHSVAYSYCALASFLTTARRVWETWVLGFLRTTVAAEVGRRSKSRNPKVEAAQRSANYRSFCRKRRLCRKPVRQVANHQPISG